MVLGGGNRSSRRMAPWGPRAGTGPRAGPRGSGVLRRESPLSLRSPFGGVARRRLCIVLGEGSPLGPGASGAAWGGVRSASGHSPWTLGSGPTRLRDERPGACQRPRAWPRAGRTPPPLPLTVPGSQTRAQAQGDSSEFRPRGAELPASPSPARSPYFCPSGARDGIESLRLSA